MSIHISESCTFRLIKYHHHLLAFVPAMQCSACKDERADVLHRIPESLFSPPSSFSVISLNITVVLLEFTLVVKRSVCTDGFTTTRWLLEWWHRFWWADSPSSSYCSPPPSSLQSRHTPYFCLNSYLLVHWLACTEGRAVRTSWLLKWWISWHGFLWCNESDFSSLTSLAPFSSASPFPV